jgi:hypothetical protein
MERIPDDYVSQTLFSLQALRSLSLYAHNHLANNTEFSERLELLILIAAFSVPDAKGNTLALARSINDTTSRNQPSEGIGHTEKIEAIALDTDRNF